MASPQADNGYTRIANEIMDNLAKIRIAGEARQMLDVIIRKTYGFNKKEDKISTSQFMKLTGLSRIAIPKARRKLLELNLITVSQKGYSQGLTYSIQKNYEKWQPYPKKDTVSKKGYRCIPKRIQNCIPKSSTQKTLKDTIQKKVLFPIQEIVEHYKKIKKYDTITNWNKEHFARATASAKRIISQADDKEHAYRAITEIGKYCDSEGLSWTIETVVKKFPDWKLGQLKPSNSQKEQRPDYLDNKIT